MKRIVLIIGALLIGLILKAQEATYTCRYWFDQNHAQAVSTTFGENGWEAELDVGGLSDGLHALHFHVLAADTVSVLNIENDSLYHAMDTAIMKWSTPQSYLFLKENATPSTSLEYRYWFDQNHTTMQSGNIGNGYLLLDVAELEEGLHALHVTLKGTEYTATQSYLFLKIDAWEQGTSNYIYHCWFDEDFAIQQTDALGSGHLLLDVNDLEEGMHTVHVLVEGTTLTSTQSYLFMKVAPFAADSIDMSHLSYHCWFDEDFEHQQTDSIGDGHFLLDVNDLEDGLHTVHVMLQGSTYTATQSYMFMKIAVEDPSDELQYICWFDQDYSSVQTGPLGSGIFELEVSELPNGIHTVNVQLDNGIRTAPQTYLFYKQPLGGYGIVSWEYWLNDDITNRQTTLISPTVDTLDIISLLTVGHPALRSSCFHFHPNGDAPYINAKNQINFRFWDSEIHFIDKSAYYVDEQVEQDIVATVFERNTTETFAAPRNNQIHWFKLDAGVGDSLVFMADKACTMQLFAPSGEEVYSATASEAMVFGGCHAWEDGTYYLAVHDQTGSGDEISVTYNWVYRYAILAYNANRAGNGGCSTITFQGNGYNSLLDVYLVNPQNDTIRNINIGHESNTTTTVTFNFYEKNLGIYDVVFQFYEETMRINDAMEVEEPLDIVLSSVVNYPATFRRGTECVYTYTITNNGNMTAYAVPIYLYISTESIDCISHVELEGLGLLAFKDYFDTDSLTQDEQELLARWSNEMGDDHYFFKIYGVDETTGDTILIRSNYFFIDLAPYETKEIKVKITSDCSNNVWMTIPSEIGYEYYDPYPPLTYNPNDPNDPNNPNGNNPGGGSGGSGGDPGGGSGGSGGDPGGGSGGSGGNPGGGSGDPGGNSPGGGPENCCVNEKLQCTLDLVCSGLDIASIFLPGLWGVVADVSSCVCDAISLRNQAYNMMLCPGNYDDDYWDALNTIKAGVSISGTVASCIQAFTRKGKFKNIMSGIGAFLNGMTLGDLLNPEGDCVQAWMNPQPDCPPGDPKGGQSTPVTPCEPNEIRGYLAESGSHYMRQEIQTITYEIESENDTTATAAAHTIIVRDTLDVNKFDVASLAAYRVTIHDKVLELSGEHNFVYTLDLRPNVYVIAQIQLECDDETGIVVWTITSLDPMTMEPTTDPNQGALPINYNGEGIATFTFNVNLKEPFPDGTEISNRVGIIFDLEEPVITDTWTNIVDAVKPTSHIEEVTFEDDTLNFSFISSDNRSGVWYHTLYYRNDSTYQEWQVKVPRIFENSYMLRFKEYQTTEYLVMAVDSAGNHEEKDMMAEYVYFYDGPEPVCQSVVLSQGWNWFSTYIEAEDPVALFDMLKAALGNNGLQIESANSGGTLYLGDGEWFGDLDCEGIYNEQMYLIEVAAGCTIHLQGVPADPAEHQITIYPGWNWIGFPSLMEIPIAEMFAGFQPEEEDLIESILEESIYIDGEWIGSGFEALVPGQGFMYFSNSTETKILVFPAKN